MWRHFSKTQKVLAVASATTATASLAYYLNSDKRKNVYKATITLQNQHQNNDGFYLLNKKNAALAEALQEEQKLDKARDFWLAPSREEMIKRLKESHKEDPYDLLVVGGGATGAGISVDAATRGLKVAMVERDDFASGKNIHVEKIKKRILSL
jgi:glycerol-3-phosphate dehydrogenase